MIIPIQSGRSIIPVYIPTTTTSTTQTYEDGSGSAPIEQITNPWAWVIIIIMIIIVLLPVCLLLKDLKEFMKGKE